jgi:hypothetical protein
MSLSDASAGTSQMVMKLSGKIKASKKSGGKSNGKGLSFKVGGTSFDLGAESKIKGKPNGKKKGNAKAIEVDEDAENTDEEMLNAAIRASYVTAAEEIKNSMATSGAGPSTSRRTRQSMSISPKKKTSPKKKSTKKADSDSDVPLAKMMEKATDNYHSSSDEDFTGGDAMDVDSDEELVALFASMKEKAQVDKQTKVIQKQEEMKERKRLGRKLTYVSDFYIWMEIHFVLMRLYRLRRLPLLSIDIIPSSRPSGVTWRSERLSSLKWGFNLLDSRCVYPTLTGRLIDLDRSNYFLSNSRVSPG